MLEEDYEDHSQHGNREDIASREIIRMNGKPSKKVFITIIH